MRPKDNPFSAQRISSIPFYFKHDNWDSIIALLAQNNFKGSVIGPHGTGKTTFLTDLTKQLQARGHHTLSLFINLDNPRLSAEQWNTVKRAPPQTIIIFDGGDILPLWAWWRFRWASRHVKGIFITSHGMKRLPAIHHTHSDNDLLEVMLSHLDVELTLDLQNYAKQSLKKNNGNIRETLRDLYWVYADK